MVSLWGPNCVSLGSCYSCARVQETTLTWIAHWETEQTVASGECIVFQCIYSLFFSHPVDEYNISLSYTIIMYTKKKHKFFVQFFFYCMQTELDVSKQTNEKKVVGEKFLASA